MNPDVTNIKSLAERERLILAPYAAHSAETPDPHH